MENSALDFKMAFKYPFNRAKGMLNILWILLPIFGWFALGGYGVRIVQEFSKGKFKQLPVLAFKSDMKLGFFMFLKSLPFVLSVMAILGILYWIDPILGRIVEALLGFLVFPVLGVHFVNKMTVASFFEFKKLRFVFAHFGDYVLMILKTVGLWLVFLVLWLVLVGIPAQSFTRNIFLADFYRRRVK